MEGAEDSSMLSAATSSTECVLSVTTSDCTSSISGLEMLPPLAFSISIPKKRLRGKLLAYTATRTGLGKTLSVYLKDIGLSMLF